MPYILYVICQDEPSNLRIVKVDQDREVITMLEIAKQNNAKGKLRTGPSQSMYNPLEAAGNFGEDMSLEMPEGAKEYHINFAARANDDDQPDGLSFVVLP